MTVEVVEVIDFEHRPRYSWDEVKLILNKGSNKIVHPIANDDGTFSAVSHIVCEYCDFCDERNRYHEGTGECPEQLSCIVLDGYLIHTAKENIYKDVGN